ncbi:hypothetical protein E7T09_11985 [Deinococcus sp. KSM4-11]|uniref:ATP-grasp domain-containing protein n=1 Tax=Deinococcus sp. KSM4-11 TaxID=2568654 RepID=UPI0010A40901|nr:ATP-grasp domain-containing protein [Deinococcus sp. KSM4-11]THF86797.1 hypothetical protein E7T09_11985 [Deinococcus sp. KSM4-11]
MTQAAWRVVFPADYFTARQPDEAFADQAAAFAGLGWKVSTFALDSDRRFRPPLEPDESVLYRGWMLTGDAYRDFEDAVTSAGATLATSHAAYLAAHHIPNWYPLLADLTPKTVCFSDLTGMDGKLAELGWDAFFVKDYVKSLKTGAGSVITRPEHIGELMGRMEQFRGQIEGGLCVRQFEPLETHTETRYFVRDGHAFEANGSAVPDIVQTVAERIPSPFFSVDIARRSDGVWRVVEIGDGQVSDLVGWTAEQFKIVWMDAMQE